MKLSKKKKIIIGAAAVVVILGGLKIATGKSGGNDLGMPVSTALTQKQDLEEILKLRAVLEGTESTEVVSRLHYEVKELYVKEGDHVTAGQLLAVLDSSDISQELSLKRGNVSLLQKQQAETLEDRQVEYDNAKKEYDDIKALFDIGAASQKELDDAKQKLDNIPSADGKAALSAAEQQTISNANQEVSIQSSTLADCQIRSKIDGTVTRVNTKVGRFADETEDDKPMFVIENIENLQMKVLVGENDIGKISIGQKADITTDSMGKESVAGEVVRISPTGELKEGSASERVIPVYININEKNDKLIAGVTARATIHIAEASQALTVPFEAIGELEDGSNVVYVVNEDNTIHIVPVELGLETDLYTEIISDELTEGQTIVLSPSLSLAEGMSVMPQ
ncbi:MAG: efflux RND transporter periplasmic adaptor subunit [Anaerotignum sp.]|jgi:HlyD family secretion protein|nr:efflux RND transporter periplasmic adaptor subunit [Anaerotignum sp.]MCI8868514.1 efflux RND transporter periplasmic adaptor subunit [Anaerotignum sp.]